MHVALDLLEDVDAGHVGQIEVEQHQELATGADVAGAVRAQQVVERSVPFCEGHDLVVDAGAADVLLDQAGMPLVVLDHDDGDGFGLLGSLTRS